MKSETVNQTRYASFSKEQRQKISRRASLKRVGWTQTRFDAQLIRQKGACAGCLHPFGVEGFWAPCVDHNHATGKCRGLLCRHCNVVLGMVKDDPMRLRRLMAYVERDVDKTMIYLIGALKNERVPQVGNLLRTQGYDVMDEWYTPGKHADENWQAYEALRGRSYTQALRGRSATNAFMFDRAYLDLCDFAVVVAPAGKSAMLELGYASGRGKPTAIFLDGQDPERYDIMPGLADKILMTENELITWLKGH